MTNGPEDTVAAVVGRANADDPDFRDPDAFRLWQEAERTRHVLDTWNRQMEHERHLRSRLAFWVFTLITAELIGVFALLALQGVGVIHLAEAIYQVFVPSLFVEVIGLGFVIVKYLFDTPSKQSLDTMVHRLGT